MKRRAFILGLSAALAGLSKALAQRNLRVVGIWWSPLQVREILIPYKARLAELGWMEGRNVRFEARAWDGDTANMRKQADELAAMHPDVIVALSNPAEAILKPVSGSLPIVFGMGADPAGSGFIQNLARPGGNITGFTNFEPSMGGKWLEVLKEIAPGVTRMLIILHPETAVQVAFLRAAESAAPSLAVTLTVAGVHDAAEI